MVNVEKKTEVVQYKLYITKINTTLTHWNATFPVNFLIYIFNCGDGCAHEYFGSPQLDMGPQTCHWFLNFYCFRDVVNLLSGGLKFLAALLVICISQQQKAWKSGKMLKWTQLVLSPSHSFSPSPSGSHSAVGEAGLFKAMVLPFGLGVHMCAGGPHFDSKSPWHQNKQTLLTAPNRPEKLWAQRGICNYSS